MRTLNPPYFRFSDVNRVLEFILPGQTAAQPLDHAVTQDFKIASSGGSCGKKHDLSKTSRFGFLATKNSTLLPCRRANTRIIYPVFINERLGKDIHTNSVMCVDAGELDGPVVASLRVLFVFLRHTFRRVSVGQSVIHQVNLTRNEQTHAYNFRRIN